jgi:hypothetical protein
VAVLAFDGDDEELAEDESDEPEELLGPEVLSDFFSALFSAPFESFFTDEPARLSVR